MRARPPTCASPGAPPRIIWGSRRPWARGSRARGGLPASRAVCARLARRVPWSYIPRHGRYCPTQWERIPTSQGRGAAGRPGGAVSVTVVTGARQVGKTTLLRAADPAAHFRYLTLDDLSTSLQARSDPSALWSGAMHVILDEVQHAPSLLSAVKAAVDAEPDRRFVLSGSANLLLMQQVTESLAGRAAYLILRPLTVGEWEGRSAPISLLQDLLEGGERAVAAVRAAAGPAPAAGALQVMARGLMPSLLAWGGESTHEWWGAYVAGYLERDLRQVTGVSSLTDFRVVMQSMSLHAGRLFNQAEIGRDTGVTRSTLSRWVGLMEVGHVVTRLPAYAGARGARLVKMPKLHWLDPSLAAFLGGHYSTASLRGSREFGGLFEGLIYHHLAVLAGLLSPPGRLYHWGGTGPVAKSTW
ncbi:MAG: ATP-binding protein [Thermoleophilia bacterium]